MILWMAQAFLCGRGQRALPGDSGAGAYFSWSSAALAASLCFQGLRTPESLDRGGSSLPPWGRGEWTIEPECWEMHQGKLLGNSELVHLEE